MRYQFYSLLWNRCNTLFYSFRHTYNWTHFPLNASWYSMLGRDEAGAAGYATSAHSRKPRQFLSFRYLRPSPEYSYEYQSNCQRRASKRMARNDNPLAGTQFAPLPPSSCSGSRCGGWSADEFGERLRTLLHSGTGCCANANAEAIPMLISSQVRWCENILLKRSAATRRHGRLLSEVGYWGAWVHNHAVDWTGRHPTCRHLDPS